MAYEGDFGGTLVPFWGYFGATLGIWTSNGRYDGCSCEFDGAIVRPNRAHKQQIHILPTFFACHRGARRRQENEQLSEPDRLGGGRGRVTPPPRRLVWRFWEVWRV